MSFYNSFISQKMTPVKVWQKQEQELLNEQFINAANLTTIEEEREFGTLKFFPILCRITSTLDSKVGDKVNDDYRTLFFQDLEYQPQLGQRYRFLDNIWIVYNTDNHNSLISSCYVRRCNNTINSLDYYGNVHEEPCVIDIKPTKSSFVEKEDMWTPTTRQIIFFQKNKWTKHLGYNSRIMYENQVYRVGVNLNFDRTSTFDKSSINLVRAYLDYDLVNEYDNLELEIADYHLPEFAIQLPEKLDLGFIPEEGTIPYTVTLNEEEVEEAVRWYSDNEEVVSINKLTGVYKIHGEGIANIICALKNNENFYSTVSIKVTSTPESFEELSIEPDNYYIPLNQEKTYEVYELLNGIKKDTTFSFAFSQLSKHYYSATTTPNSFTIYNKKCSENILLKVDITNNTTQETNYIYIELGGLF